MSDSFTVIEEETSEPIKGKRETPKEPTTKKGRVTVVDTLITDIEQFYSMIGVALTSHPKTAYDGMMVLNNAPALAESWRDPIERNPKIKEVWRKVFAASGYGALITAHLTIAIPIMQHHNILPSPKEPQRTEETEET